MLPPLPLVQIPHDLLLLFCPVPWLTIIKCFSMAAMLACLGGHQSVCSGEPRSVMWMAHQCGSTIPAHPSHPACSLQAGTGATGDGGDDEDDDVSTIHSS